MLEEGPLAPITITVTVTGTKNQEPRPKNSAGSNDIIALDSATVS
ncbi:hypothetical protein [Actinospica acidithermotolerans]|nr:hypothetical protein [Actinospica acidithermotolerans]